MKVLLSSSPPLLHSSSSPILTSHRAQSVYESRCPGSIPGWLTLSSLLSPLFLLLVTAVSHSKPTDILLLDILMSLIG